MKQESFFSRYFSYFYCVGIVIALTINYTIPGIPEKEKAIGTVVLFAVSFVCLYWPKKIKLIS